MERSKTIFLSKIAISLLLFVFIDHLLVRILLIVFVALDGYKDTLFFVFVVTLVFLNESYRYDLIPIGVVDKVTNKTVLVEKGLYRVRLYDNSYQNGDILFFTGAKRLDNADENRNNVLFQSDIHCKKVGTLRLRKWAVKRIETYDDTVRAALKKLIFNEYADVDLNIGYGFSFYYVLLLIYRKNRHFALFISIAYSLVFGFELKLLLFFVSFIIDGFKFDRSEKLSIKVLTITIINHHLLTNYSFLIGFVFSLMSLMGQNKGTLLMVLCETWFFKKISFLHMFAFKAVLLMRAVSFIMGLLCFFFRFLSPVFLLYLRFQSAVFSLDTFALRGSPDLLLLIILAIMILIFKISKESLKIVLYCALLLLPLNEIFPSVSFIDVGQGDAILISDYFGQHHCLIDTGSPFNYSKLQNYLFSKGIYRLDRLIITHDDADHNGNIASLLEDFEIERVVTEKTDVRISDLYLKNIDSGSYDNKNAGSLVYSFKYHDLSFLFTGDITSKTEFNILSQKLIDEVDVLKVSHHGSDTATSELFISRILPRFALISTSGMYDHPKPEVLKILEQYCVRTFITKDDGTVRFLFTPLGNFIKTGSGNFVIID